MSKEIWCEAHEQLSHLLKREPTEDEIIDYIAARKEELSERVAEMGHLVQPDAINPLKV